MKKIKISDHTLFPGVRKRDFGDFSGEEFRDDILIPALMSYDNVIIDFDDVMGYGSSFLEESFGGLVRKKIDDEKINLLIKNFISNDDPYLKDEIKQYIDDARKLQNSQKNKVKI